MTFHSGGSPRAFAVALVATACLPMLAGCRTSPPHAPLETVDHVDLDRFMGDWYVLANIPTRLERGAHNAVESYRLSPDGARVLTRFTFRAGSFDGPVRQYEPVGFILDRRSNAVWGMRFVWPFKADYRIAYLDQEYRTTIIAREARDYVWLMARTPTIPADEYEEMVGVVNALGYDTSKLQRVPQSWPARPTVERARPRR